MAQNNNISVFNPVKEEVDGKKAHRVIWSTASLDLALAGILQGRKLIANPFYEGNSRLLKGDLVFQRTQEEILEWRRCKKDILYFARKCKLMTPEGIKHIKLRDYQKDYLKHLVDNQMSIFLSARQSGKTTTSAIFLLWFILFNFDKNALITGNKYKTAKEILDKIKSIYLELPYYLKPGIYKWNESEIVLDNGCRVMSEATTINSGIGFTIHVLLCDEFAHIPPTILEPFYNNILPTVTAAKAKVMLTSTQNGYNLFYRLWTYAKQGISDFAPFEVTWDMIPEWNPDTHTWEVRDEKWHRRQVANYGSEEAFNKQFGTNFDINANTLINAKYIKKIRPRAVEFKNAEIPGVEYSEHFFWHPLFDPMTDLRKSHIVITIDIAEGKDQDFTTYVFNRIINNNGDTECIGIFHANDLDTEQCTRALQEVICFHMHPDRTLVSLETNLFGELFLNQLNENADKLGGIFASFDPSVLIKYWNKAGTDFTYGIRVTSGNKSKGCVLFKQDYERNKIINDSTMFLGEIENFCDSKGTGTYASSFGHDDVVMAQMQLVFAKQSLQFKMLLDDYTTGVIIENDKVYNPYNMQEQYQMVSSGELPIQSMNVYDMMNMDQMNNVSRLNRGY